MQKFSLNYLIRISKTITCGNLYKINNLYKKKPAIYSFWAFGINFGDGLNPYFISHITGRKSILVSQFKGYEGDHYIVIGSILGMATDKSIVWGAGYIGKGKVFKTPPKKICAVRGPKTRQKLLEENIECPEVYGDPALLLPRLYLPKVETKYDLGIIPHVIDKEHEMLERFKHLPNIKIIDVKRCNPLDFIDDILSCKKIASSSLHGIIVADAYGIPSTWIEFSGDNIIGGSFKFHDYYLSVKRKIEKPLKIQENTSLNDIYDRYENYLIDIDLEMLIEACPFSIEIKQINENKIFKRI